MDETDRQLKVNHHSYYFMSLIDNNKILDDAINVQRIGHIAIRVKDVERAKSFYMSLGMNLVWDDKDWCYLEVGPGRDGLALLGPNYNKAGPHFAFHFTQRSILEKIHSQLKSSGVIVGPLHDHRDGTASFYLQDPDGNLFEMLYLPQNGIKGNQ